MPRKTSRDVDTVKTILARDKEIVAGLRRKNTELKKKVNTLMRSNKKMVALVEELDTRVQELSTHVQKHHRYSFEEGGWHSDDEVQKKKLELNEEGASIESINTQLTEILRLIRRNKT